MCGLVARYSYHQSAPPVDMVELTQARDLMVTRGPDNAGNWFSPCGRIGLSHRRLAILDLSDSGNQPMSDATGRFHIVYNGEIYNSRELRATLQAGGVLFRSTSDTEVLVEGFARCGEAMLGSLRGMYALAIWDAEQRRLFLARDPYGIKPLYYADDGRCFTVASQVKVLAALRGIDTSVHPAAPVGFLLWGAVPDPFTWYRGIRALPAGHLMRVDEHGAHPPISFLSIAEEIQRAEHSCALIISAKTSQAEVRSALRESMKAHMLADVPVGVFLSAGIDSALVLATSRESDCGALTAVTLGFEEYRDSADDEVPGACLAASLYHADHCYERQSHQGFRGIMDRYLQAMDQPTIDGLNTFLICEFAHRLGFKVMISGVGGDELFGGYSTFHDVPAWSRRLAWMHGHTAWGRLFRVASLPVLRRFTSPKYAGVLEYGGSWAGVYLLRRAVFMPWELFEILDPEMVVDGWRALEALDPLAALLEGLRHPHARVSALESSWYLRHQLLRDTDWASMAHSVEVRTPLVDLHLLRQLLPHVLAHGWKKPDIARSLEHPLPDSILKRTKTGFTTPLNRWLSQDLGIKERGLRGWAKYLTAHFLDQRCVFS